ncbi:D-glycero-alpha-D-manno-heptose-1,7-bisphosphate 7-phosphatase [Desulfovibrio ferrophilus]|uniref:D,D-heptose 1,7-bisphosphate phosphatase n=1 Tax=Desulfovibrio ferrophilus TaxID=241368 RepID=A0A2Z6AYX4_9BACT|nr:HAD family hydrolase [Desulfovibrio ferrophilus]BBD08375.1 histidinol-phosphate phosphatase family protein [Desulfovibrio ferrophilus]
MKNIQTIILDRDGTVIHDKHYLHDPDGVELLPGAARALASLTQAGMSLYIATNQSGIGRGYFNEKDYHAVEQRLDHILKINGVHIGGSAFCPHAPEECCNCRKPATGLWETLVQNHGLSPETTVMIGDKTADVSLGLNAKLAASVLVLTGKGQASAQKLGLPELTEAWMELTEQREGWPHVVARDLEAACGWLLSKIGMAE